MPKKTKVCVEVNVWNLEAIDGNIPGLAPRLRQLADELDKDKELAEAVLHTVQCIPDKDILDKITPKDRKYSNCAKVFLSTSYCPKVWTSNPDYSKAFLPVNKVLGSVRVERQLG